MSRYQSEAPKGQPTHVPAIKVNGLDNGSPEYQAVVDLYSGSIRQFHASQQQQVNLSGQRQYKASLRVPGATMTYLNNEGQETITMVVDTLPGGGEQPPEPPDEYWRWAIIETTIPGVAANTYADMSAFMVPVPKGKLGIAHDGHAALDLDRPPLAYPDPYSSLPWLGDITSNDQVSSLLVDLRPFPGGVKFDLYGYIPRYIDSYVPGSPISPQRAMWRGSNGVSKSTTYTLLNGITQSWWSSGDISGRTQTNYQYKTSGSPATSLTDIGLAFPAIAGPFSTTAGMPAPFGATWSGDGPSYAGLSITWTPGHNTSPDPTTMNLSGLESAAGGLFTETTTMQPDGVSYAVRGIGMQTYTTDFGTGVDTLLNGAGPTDSMGNWSIEFFDYTIYHIAQHPTVPHYTYPNIGCPVNWAVFDGPLADSYSGVNGAHDYSTQWEDAKSYPKRWKFIPFKDKLQLIGVDDTTLDTSIANHFGGTKLGTVIINPRKGKGGIKFMPA